MNGALLIDKPEGITSHDVVNRVRRLTGQRRVGHIGTLDPFATGLMVVLLGKATRLARFYEGATKSYEAVMRVGFVTDTYDRTGTPQGPDRGAEFQAALLPTILEQFRGSLLQRPPAYSAKKVSGVAAYKKARKGQEVDLAPVAVAVSELSLSEISNSLVKFSVTVSSGTYIRSLAHDIGERLGLGAHLHELRRTAVAAFRLSDAVKLEDLEKPEILAASLIPMERLLPQIPERQLSASEVQAVLHGRSVDAPAAGEWLRLMGPDGALLALARLEGAGYYHPEVVLCDAVPEASSDVHEDHAEPPVPADS